MLQTYEGGCHCGRVRFRIRVDLEQSTVGECNCSVFLGIILGDWAERQATAADNLRPRVLPNAALELLHFEQARETLVGGAAHPLAMGLHQSSHEFFDSFEVRRGGVPSPTPNPHTLLHAGGWGSRAFGSEWRTD